tara:strand:- start:2362 stop:2802 length:441 start_codon:yes stop_codon:yes gene_type:complete
VGKRIIDVWAQNLLKQPFQWGITDCHQVLYQFVKLNNPNWSDPLRVGRLKGTYSTWREANEVAKTLDMPEAFSHLGYNRRPINRVEAGDIVVIETKNRAWDLYMPVVFGQTVLVGDPKTKLLRLCHIDEFERSFEVYRRDECQQPY